MSNNDNQSPLLVVLFVGQLLTLLAVAGVGWMSYSGMDRLARAVGTLAEAQPAAADNNRRAPERPTTVSGWEKIIRPENATLGPEDAKVTIIEFSDFDCPFCKRFFEGSRKQLIDEYGDQIRFVFKNLPLERIHPNAKGAAIAAQCANRQGKFWEYYASLFDNQRNLTETKLLEIGDELGLGGDFKTCLTNQETKAEVEQDMKDAMGNSLRGTPSFVVNGTILPGAVPFERFQAVIDPLL